MFRGEVSVIKDARSFREKGSEAVLEVKNSKELSKYFVKVS